MSTDRNAGRPARGFLTRLKRAEAGNVLPIMAMALIPIAGMVGSGLDMSRAYMAKAKLQNACDSAALAARREMSGGAFSRDKDENGEPDAKEEGERFFTFNFPEGTMGAASFTPVIRASTADASVVEVSAETTVPTTIMQLFGRERIPIAVACDADKDFVYNDIMLVLDVTGSMNCPIGSGRSGCSDSEGAQSNSRVTALRNGAAKLYQALESASEEGFIRYGFMPYSVTTNVGADLNTGWVRNPSIYHIYSDGRWTTTDKTQSNSWLSSWRTTTNSSNAGAWGCVEERSSWANRTNSAITISTTVAKQDIDEYPKSSQSTAVQTAMKWVPYDPDTVSLSSSSEACPARAKNLNFVTEEETFQTQLNAAISIRRGNTHHDVGMVWGMRYLSSSGLFESRNPTTRPLSGNDIPVKKHIIFFTDGLTQVSDSWYSAVGIPALRRRMSGSGDDANRAKARFQSACNRARQMDMTVWVIALDIGFAESTLRNCANSNDHYFVAENADALDDAFDLIGKGIGKLRLTN